MLGKLGPQASPHCQLSFHGMRHLGVSSTYESEVQGSWTPGILGVPGAASRDDGIFMGRWAKVYNKSGRAPGHLLLPNEFQKRLKSHLLTGQKNFSSGQSAKRNSRATLMSSYTRLFSSSIAVVSWPVQREHF